MHKKDLIDGLKRFVASHDKTDKVRWKGQKSFANFLIYYLENLKIPHDEKYDFWTIEHHLPELMVDAFEQLRMGTDETIAGFRERYEMEVGHEVPNIIDLGASNIFEQDSAVQTTLGFLLRDITGLDWVEHKIDVYCNAQKYVLQQTFDKFLRLVYRRGLGEIANKCNNRGMSGEFGETEFRTFIVAGRIMFTFARRIDKNKESCYKGDDNLYCNELTVSFVGEEGDPLCLSAGIQSVYGDFRTVLDMIEEVIKYWPQDANEQKKLYKANVKVAIG